MSTTRRDELFGFKKVYVGEAILPLVTSTNEELNQLDNKAPFVVETVLGTNTLTDVYTLALTDAGRLLDGGVLVAKVITIPPYSSVPFPLGTTIFIRKAGTGNQTITAGSGVTLSGGALILANTGGILINYAVDKWVKIG